MPLQTKKGLLKKSSQAADHSNVDERIFSKDYIDFLNDAGWRLEKKLPSNTNNYSDLLEDTDWKSNHVDLRCTRHYRRDLDALS